MGHRAGPGPGPSPRPCRRVGAAPGLERGWLPACPGRGMPASPRVEMGFTGAHPRPRTPGPPPVTPPSRRLRPTRVPVPARKPSRHTKPPRRGNASFVLPDLGRGRRTTEGKKGRERAGMALPERPPPCPRPPRGSAPAAHGGPFRPRRDPGGDPRQKHRVREKADDGRAVSPSAQLRRASSAPDGDFSALRAPRRGSIRAQGRRNTREAARAPRGSPFSRVTLNQGPVPSTPGLPCERRARRVPTGAACGAAGTAGGFALCTNRWQRNLPVYFHIFGPRS